MTASAPVPPEVGPQSRRCTLGAALWKPSLTDVGWLLSLLAIAEFVYELVVGIEAGAWRMIPVGQIWFDLHPFSLNFVQAIVQRYIHPFVWDPVLATVLQWPAWSLLGAPGAILVSLYPLPRS